MNLILKHYYGLTESRPTVALAPMAGVTDVPFRHICEKLGADYSVSEMVASAPQLLESEKNQTRLGFTPEAKTKILQIIGNDADNMAFAAQLYSSMGADIIDVNLGCPAKKVNKKGAGSALLSSLPEVANILAAVTQSSSVPVTVKTRLGPDHENYTLLAVAKILLDLDIKVLTVHGRTRSDKFNGSAQFSEIAKVKRAFPELTVIANGDITSTHQALKVIAETGCDGLMIGRGAMGNPWLFGDILGKLTSDHTVPIFDRNALIIEHMQQTHELYGDVKGVRFARKHIQAYCEKLGIEDGFRVLAKITDKDEQLYKFEKLLSEHTKI